MTNLLLNSASIYHSCARNRLIPICNVSIIVAVRYQKFIFQTEKETERATEGDIR